MSYMLKNLRYIPGMISSKHENVSEGQSETGFSPQIKINTIFNQILTSNSKQKSQVVYLFL